MNSFKYKKHNVSYVPAIDTLYFFVDISCENYSIKYVNDLINGFYRDEFSFIGHSGKSSGFVGSWYVYKKDKMDLFRVGFKNPKKQKNVKNVYVQLTALGIYLYGAQKLSEIVLQELSKDFDFDKSQTFVSRADINMFVTYDFSKYESLNFRSRAVYSQSNYSNAFVFDKTDKAKEINKKQKLETLYLGSKNSPIVFKIYNKKVELIEKVRSNDAYYTYKYVVMRAFLSRYNIDIIDSDDTPLWNIEFSLKRVALKEYSINSLDDLFRSAGYIFKDLMNKYVFLDYSKKVIERYKKTNSLNKLKMSDLWFKLSDAYNDYKEIEVFRNVEDRHRATKEHKLYQIKRVIESSFDLGIEITYRDLSNVLREVA